MDITFKIHSFFTEPLSEYITMTDEHTRRMTHPKRNRANEYIKKDLSKERRKEKKNKA